MNARLALAASLYFARRLLLSDIYSPQSQSQT